MTTQWKHDARTGRAAEIALTIEEAAKLAAAQEQQRLAREIQEAAEAARQADLAPVRFAQIRPLLDELDADLALLAGTPTTADLRAVLERTVQRQRRIMRALAEIVG